jgi:hypothetical protein
MDTKIIHSNLTNNDIEVRYWEEKWITQFTINGKYVELDRAKTKELIKFLKECVGK